MPETIYCNHEGLFGLFQEGGGDEPAAFRSSGSGWTTTSAGARPAGEPAILTWSIVPDGTTLPQGQGEPNTPSNLIAFLDGIHHGGPGPGGADITQRAWFPLVKSAFDRWDAVSGIKFTFEPNDDGVPLGGLNGAIGQRGDHRIGGHSIDGTTSPTVVAYNYFPNIADMVIDTDEVGRLGHPGLNYIRFRNTLMHEIGHGLGLNHLGSNGSNFLMEATLDATIDGPQFDDILGIHYFYGDRYEENGGNDHYLLATNLGPLAMHQTLKLGEDAVDKPVAPTDVDFVSINKNSDTDYFKISLAKAGKLEITLDMIGPTYDEGTQTGAQTSFNTSVLGDLSLYLYDSTGVNLLASSLNAGFGVTEKIPFLDLPSAGDYFIRVSGTLTAAIGGRNMTQFYQLDVALVPEPTTLILCVAGAALTATRRRPADGSLY